MRMTKIAVGLGIMLLASSTWAGGLRAKHLPGAAKWVLHLDMAAAKQSKIGKSLIEMARGEGMDVQLQAIEQMFSIHLLDDVNDVTMCGIDDDENNALFYLSGKLDVNALTTIAKAIPGYATSAHGRYAIHQWPDDKLNPNGEKRLVYACFADKDMVVLSASLDSLKTAVDTVDGSSKSLDAAAAFPGFGKDKSPFLMMGATGIAQMDKAKMNSPALSMVNDISITLGEMTDKLNLSGRLTALNAETLLQIKQSVEGIVAMMTLNSQENPQMAEFARAIKVKDDGKALFLDASWPVDPLIEFMKKAHAAKKAGAAAGHGGMGYDNAAPTMPEGGN